MTTAQSTKSRGAIRPAIGNRGRAGSQIATAKLRVQLSLLGSLSLHLADAEIDVRCRKARALVAYLALTPGMREIAESVLPDSLRMALHERGITGLVVDNHDAKLDGGEFPTDLDNIMASVERGDPAERLMSEGRITDELLPGHDDIDPSFGAWLRVKRESIRQSLIQGLEDRLSDGLVSARLQKANRMDPPSSAHEVGCRHGKCCRRALAVYGQLWSTLEKDYDIEPSVATQELAVAIKNGPYPAH
jgi:DNA-binding SARP family transcriptional activator